MARKYGSKSNKQAKSITTATGNTALYLRVSTALQADEGNSLDAQREKLLAHCAAKGWTVDEQNIYVDAGISGKSTEGRDAFNAMLQAAADGQIDRIVVTKRDRFARNTVDFLTKTDELSRLGVALVCLDIDLDTSTPTGRLIATVFAGFAEWEASLITDRVMTGKQQNVKLGGYNGGRCPLGYTYAAGRFTPNERADLVKSIFAMWNSGQSLNAIMRYLEDAKQPTPTGKGAWSVKTVKHILANGAYAGLAQWGEDNEYPSQRTATGNGNETAPVYPTIINRATYDAAQARLEGLTRGKRVDRAV